MANNETPYVSVRDLTVKTPQGPVFEGVSFDVYKGQVICLYGSEGSGKTALLLTLGGRMKPSSGTGTVGGYDLRKQYVHVREITSPTIIHRINDVPENLSLHDILASELSLAGKKSNKAAVKEILKEWGLDEFEKTAYRSIDSDDRIAFNVLLARLTDPEVLLVDDIQTGVSQHRSIETVEQFKDYARRENKMVFFCCLEYDVAKHADGIIVLSQKAERQRLRSLNDKGPDDYCPILGHVSNIEISGLYSDDARGAHARTNAERMA